jgi:predicted nuclease of predicted toxin-antitoxin system
LKLLFDENLAPSLVLGLADVFPDSGHVARIGLGTAQDREVWEYAREYDYRALLKIALRQAQCERSLL